MTTIVAPLSNAGKWQMGFNSAFKGLTQKMPLGSTDCCGRLVHSTDSAHDHIK
jgi:hypothetical protein